MTCAAQRLHSALSASVPIRSCVLPAGHTGCHRDRAGGTFTPEGVGEKVTRSARTPGGGQGDTTGEAEPLAAETGDAAGTAKATVLAERLTELLAVRGNAARTRHALRVADRVFDALHEHLRCGGTLPCGWGPGKGADGRRYTTAWFDVLSETLRHPNARPTPRATADAAEVAWTALDAALRAGRPIPEPWDGPRRR